MKIFSCFIIFLFCDFLENSLIVNSQFIGFDNQVLNNNLLSLAQMVSYLSFIPISAKINKKYFALFINFSIVYIGVLLFLIKYLGNGYKINITYTIIMFILKFMNGLNMSVLFLLIADIFNPKQKIIYSGVIFFLARLLLGNSEIFTNLAVKLEFHRITFVSIIIVITFPFYYFIKSD